ncbi:MAG: glutamate formimidoyltransferase [Ignavibacteriales bacterium]|nr:glutamate formimidoyltransferase [Ignavibacteriales bacterium]
MKQIVECVPNFSDGRTLTTIEAIAASVRSVSGVKLLNVEPDNDYNRTVVTFVGEPPAVVEAAFQATKTASLLIDMNTHKGAHPRIGATDVVPFIPISGVTMDECVQLANVFGRRVAEELDIPIYLYEYAARSPQRRNLADIRKGEYEGLPEKLNDPAWFPDYGAATFNSKSGATVTGARKFLIAYNVNLGTPDDKLAHEIALRIRESGRPKKGPDGKPLKDENVETIKIPGTLKAVKAMGVRLERFNISQVSINLVDFETTSMHDAFEEVKKQAFSLGVEVAGSELVGLTPLKAVLMAGKFYSQGQPLEDRELVELAVRKLGLNQLEPFDPKKKIIEYQLEEDSPMLVKKTVLAFLDETASNSPAPGGGSIAALAGTLGAALTSMVCRLTIGKKKYADVQETMEEVLSKAEALRARLTAIIDADTAAFNNVMAAFGLPKETEEQMVIRSKAIQGATKEATLVPFHLMKLCEEALALTKIVAEKGNPNSISDAGVAALMLHAACEGAKLNVKINLSTISDEQFVARLRSDIAGIAQRVKDLATAVEFRITSVIG